MKTAEEYFESKNGGKSAEQATQHGEYITPTWAVILMKDFAAELKKENEAKEKEIEGLRRDDSLPMKAVIADRNMFKRDFESAYDNLRQARAELQHLRELISKCLKHVHTSSWDYEEKQQLLQDCEKALNLQSDGKVQD